MCGRFTLRTPANLIVEQFFLESAPDWTPRFNIAPTQLLFCVRKELQDSPRAGVALRWGLVPFWADDLKIGNRMINARADGVADKPAFRAAFKKRRCLVVADGYYEWKTIGKQKQPYWIRLADERPFAFAGLWERWDKDGEPVETATIITTDGNDLTRAIHDRMPVILDAADYDRWLDPTYADKDELLRLLRPYDAPLMKVEPVSPEINNVKNEVPPTVLSA